jgi:hypothetical protein
MFGLDLGKLELYGIIAAVSLIAALGWGWHEHHAGYKEAQDDAREALEKANAKTDALQARLDKSAEDRANEIARLNSEHTSELAAAIGNVKPVIVRVPADSGQMPASGSGSGATATATNGPADLSVSTSIDIAPALVMLAGECQRDRDALIGWQSWYASQREIAGWL